MNKYAPLREQKAVTQQELDNAVQANDAALAQVKPRKPSAGRRRLRCAPRGADGDGEGGYRAPPKLRSRRPGPMLRRLNSISASRGSSRPLTASPGSRWGRSAIWSCQQYYCADTISTVTRFKVDFNVKEQESSTPAAQSSQFARNAAARQIALELVLSDGRTYPHSGTFFVADRQVDPRTGAIRLAGIFPNLTT